MVSQRKHPKYEYLTSRWGGMKLRAEFADKIDNWLQNFDENDRELLLSLLSQFYYYSEEKIKEKTIELFQKFSNTTDKNINEMVFTKIIKDLGTSYSDILFNTFWLSNNLYDQSEPQILALIENLNENELPDVICIIDDYSGTGKTFIKTVNKILETNHFAAKTHIYFLTLHITKTALNLINKYSDDTGIKIDVVYLDLSDKAFNCNYLYDQVEAQKKRLHYLNLCTKNKTNKDYIFGFEEIESLVAFHYNTPNNTLGLFWQDFSDFMTLFPRHRKRKTDLYEMQKNSKKRRAANNINVIFGFDDAKFALFMAYCVAPEKSFSFEQAKIDFGLTSDQLSDLINRMLKEGYVVVQNEKFIATAKLKSNIFTSRLTCFKKQYKDNSLVEKQTSIVAVSYVPKKF